MASAQMLGGMRLLFVLLSVPLVASHVVLTYPPWRGNTLITNDQFPYGMQWSYPCGGLGVTTNRSYWPLNGGAVAMQPGWFTGHEEALMYINLGLGAQPQNYSWVMVPRFEITGPTDNPYNATFCLPQVPLPSGVTVKSGDLATIQVVEAAKHGAGLFACADIIFTDDMSKVPAVTPETCFNSTNIKVDNVEVVKATEAAAFCASVTSAPSPTGSDIWGFSTATNSRAHLFASTTTTAASSTSSVVSSNDANGRGVSRLSGLLSLLFFL